LSRRSRACFLFPREYFVAMSRLCQGYPEAPKIKRSRNFAEPPQAEVRRTPLPRTPVNIDSALNLQEVSNGLLDRCYGIVCFL
jgi:hypothetical protein